MFKEFREPLLVGEPNFLLEIPSVILSAFVVEFPKCLFVQTHNIDQRRLENGFSREGLLHLLKLAIEKRMRFTGLLSQSFELGSIAHQMPVYLISMREIIGYRPIDLLER